MTDAEHTIGPWFIEGTRLVGTGKIDSLWLSSHQSNGVPIPVFELIPVVGDEAQHLIDARLLAAAPDMLKALEVAQQALLEVRSAQARGPGWYTKGTVGLFQQVRFWLDKGDKEIDEAIAKAKGQTE